MKRYDYNKLKGKIKECFPTQSKYAQKLKISDTSLSYKLNNKRAFDQDEIQDTIELFNLTPQETMDYFFSPQVDKISTRNGD